MRVKIGHLEIILDSPDELDLLLERFGKPVSEVLPDTLEHAETNGRVNGKVTESVVKRHTSRRSRAKVPTTEGLTTASLLAFLMHAGPKRIDAIAHHFDCDREEIVLTLEHEWFEKDGVMWRLSSEGHTEANKDSMD